MIPRVAYRLKPVLLSGLVGLTVLHGNPAEAGPAGVATPLDAVQQLFYNGRYAEAAEQARTLTASEDPLAIYEVRTTAVLFQVRRAIGEPANREKAVKACVTCPELLASFTREFEAGRAAAREALRLRPRDPVALFFLGKLDLNFVWLHLGTLGKRTGWDEYWEARHSLDAALVEQPDYLRARVARAWIDYIVDTKMPWGTGWLLGGGNKKRALKVMHEAAQQTDDFYAHAEALFGLWDMQVREKQSAAALQSALRLADLFPENPEVSKYVRTWAR